MICTDCIHKEVCGLEGYYDEALTTCTFKTELPHNTGHWIADVDKWGDVVTTVNGYRCDNCNAFNSDKDNYCPNCGAKMIEPQEISDRNLKMWEDIYEEEKRRERSDKE